MFKIVIEVADGEADWDLMGDVEEEVRDVMTSWIGRSFYVLTVTEEKS